MDDTVEIVPIRQDHIESFHRALDFVARERRYLAFLEAPPELVALSAGEVIGWCDVTPKPRPIYAHSGVLGIALLPEFRSRGIGRQLIDRTLIAARTFGFHRVELTVRENNANAIELYKTVGFEIEGLQRDAVKVNGVFENVVMMATLV